VRNIDFLCQKKQKESRLLLKRVGTQQMRSEREKERERTQRKRGRERRTLRERERERLKGIREREKDRRRERRTWRERKKERKKSGCSLELAATVREVGIEPAGRDSNISQQCREREVETGLLHAMVVCYSEQVQRERSERVSSPMGFHSSVSARPVSINRL
jgi:hypothetical protein